MADKPKKSKALIQGDNLIINKALTRELTKVLGGSSRYLESIIIQQIHYWCEINKGKNHNYKDDHYWVYNSFEEWQKQLEFWSVSTIKRAFKDLTDKGYLIKGKYNKLKLDKTNWYRVEYKKIENIMADHDVKMNLPSCQNEPTESVSLNQPIPENTTENTQKPFSHNYSYNRNDPPLRRIEVPEDYLIEAHRQLEEEDRKRKALWESMAEERKRNG